MPKKKQEELAPEMKESIDEFYLEMSPEIKDLIHSWLYKIVEAAYDGIAELPQEHRDKMLMKIADNYDEEVEALVGGLVSLLEPVMVVVLGDTTASNLFGDSTLAVGQSIRINGQSFRVIGVLASRANALIVTNDPAIDRVYLHRKTPRGLLRTFRQIREQNTMSSSTS
jgi:hypothetical protein